MREEIREFAETLQQNRELYLFMKEAVSLDKDTITKLTAFINGIDMNRWTLELVEQVKHNLRYTRLALGLSVAVNIALVLVAIFK